MPVDTLTAAGLKPVEWIEMDTREGGLRAGLSVVAVVAIAPVEGVGSLGGEVEAVLEHPAIKIATTRTAAEDNRGDGPLNSIGLRLCPRGA